ncbi:MAG: RNA polymerase sigma factor [Mycobacteriales bacterium]
MRTSPTGRQAVADLYAGSYSRLVRALTLAAAGQSGLAEECVQEAFVRLLGRWDRIGTYDDPEAWVRSVAFRLLSNRRRSAARGLRALVRHGAAPDAAAPSPDRVDVLAALAQLPLHQRTALVLHHMVGLSVEEVARELGVPAGTVKSRLGRGRAALEPLLHQEDSRA